MVSALWDFATAGRASRDELQHRRTLRLGAMIRHAAATVPYYRALFTSAGVSPDEVRSLDDLAQIPTTAKHDLTAAGFQKITATGTDPQACWVTRTSGSSGKPFSTYLSRRERLTRRALGLRRLVQVGLRPSDLVCVVSDPTQMHGWRFRTRCLPVLMPPQQQLELLQTMQPTILKAWPSCLRVLRHHAGYRLGRVVRPRIVATSGEECDEQLRREITADVQAEMFEFYAAGELGPIAFECRAHRGLHINADQLIVECANDGGIKGASEPRELLITSLYNFTMPFIRYRLGDAGIIQDSPCPCGSNFPLITTLRGQRNYTVMLPDGRLLSVAALVNTALRPFPTLHKFRLIQNALQEYVLESVFLESPSAEILSRMRDRMAGGLGPDVRFDIAVVESIDEEGVRKFGNFVSRLADTQRCLPKG